jgi:hypothetical protein
VVNKLASQLVGTLASQLVERIHPAAYLVAEYESQMATYFAR